MDDVLDAAGWAAIGVTLPDVRALVDRHENETFALADSDRPDIYQVRLELARALCLRLTGLVASIEPPTARREILVSVSKMAKRADTVRKAMAQEEAEAGHV